LGGNQTAGNGGSVTASPVVLATSGVANYGGGGGGSDQTNSQSSGAGGSGVVILRYPFYLAPATSTTGSPETYVTGFWRVYRFVASGTITF
jgi:hypothetical protein